MMKSPKAARGPVAPSKSSQTVSTSHTLTALSAANGSQELRAFSVNRNSIKLLAEKQTPLHRTAPFKISIDHPQKRIKMETSYRSLSVKSSSSLSAIKIKIKSPRDDVTKIISALDYLQERLGIEAPCETRLNERNPVVFSLQGVTPFVLSQAPQKAAKYFIERSPVPANRFEMMVVLKPVVGEENLYEEYDPKHGLQQAFQFQYSAEPFEGEVLVLTAPIEMLDESECETVIVVKLLKKDSSYRYISLPAKWYDSSQALKERLFFYTGIHPDYQVLSDKDNHAVSLVKYLQQPLIMSVTNPRSVYDITAYHYYPSSILSPKTRFSYWKATQENEATTSNLFRAALKDKSYQVRYKLFCQKISAILVTPLIVESKMKEEEMSAIFAKADALLQEVQLTRFKCFTSNEDKFPCVRRLDTPSAPTKIALSDGRDEKHNTRLKFENFFTGDEQQLEKLKKSGFLIKYIFQQSGFIGSGSSLFWLSADYGLAELYNDNHLLRGKLFHPLSEKRLQHAVGSSPQFKILAVIEENKYYPYKDDLSIPSIDITKVSFNLPPNHASKLPTISAILQAIDQWVNKNKKEVELTEVHRLSLTAVL